MMEVKSNKHFTLLVLFCSTFSGVWTDLDNFNHFAATTEAGPNNVVSVFKSVICFSFSFYSTNTSYFSFVIGFDSWQQKRYPDDDHRSTLNHRREKLLVGWEHMQVQNNERTTLPPDQMERCGTRGRQWEEGEANEKKAQETSNDVSWAIGNFFTSQLSILLLKNLLGTN